MMALQPSQVAPHLFVVHIDGERTRELQDVAPAQFASNMLIVVYTDTSDNVHEFNLVTRPSSDSYEQHEIGIHSLQQAGHMERSRHIPRTPNRRKDHPERSLRHAVQLNLPR